ncbi:Flagellar biosynthesis protein flhA [Oligella ureolytica]|uniref:Flagellar biosynthesis protein FlhA n=1 Tax=Oligella ureolytica TaxID=90244 RepID=A0A378XHG3_9BURK|nr:flagellar biosynthesis protein FlhA [Oligella ureolytica]QPT39103.1 flagellar biosynthesis protein FlhA [Oligella ureolytica]SUA54809.1 Flagellar biosynthesis protein flhA [Oligella ureolytica]
MNSFFAILKPNSANSRMLVGPLLIIMVMAMMVLPLPPFLLDLFFTFNIAMSIMILLVAMFTKKPLDFASFPSVLLFATLLRLSLNVASTRVVLMHGHTGPDAAGQVIEAFGHFLVGGNFAVGIVVFAILVLINFVVITKGAGRIAEVGARFTLDAMPGKQMAIDADLNAGLIAEDDARKRRAEVAQEAEFYGAMDGASKFVRGDAVAGLIIMFVSIIGGLLVGILQHDLSFAEAGEAYTLLTIGDGLVGQIPALIISTAAGVVVSRVANNQDVGQQMVGQLFSNPLVLYITATIIGIMGLIPNMPHLAFLLLAAVFFYIGYRIQQKNEKISQQPDTAAEQAPAPDDAQQEARWDDVSLVEPFAMEVGYRLISLVDQAQGAELISRIRSLRKQFAQNVGFLPPAVHIRDNLELHPSQYRILLSGVEIAKGQIQPGKWLAIDPGGVEFELTEGEKTVDPTFGLTAYWINEDWRERAQVMGYTVVDASTVIATHINHLLGQHAAHLLGRQEVQQLLDHIAKEEPRLVEDFVPKAVSLTTLHNVLRGLLNDGVYIRDMRTIVEVLTEWGPILSAQTQPGMMINIEELIARVRTALGRSITQQCFGDTSQCNVIGLSPQLTQVLTQALTTSGTLEPGLADNLHTETELALQKQMVHENPSVLVVSPLLRASLARMFKHAFPQLTVLANTEIPEDRIMKMTAVIGG